VSCPSQSIGLPLTVCPARSVFSAVRYHSYCSRRSASVPTVSRGWYTPLAQSALQTLRSHYATHLTVIQFLQRSIRSLAFFWVSGTERCFACLSPGQSCSGLSGCGAIQGHQEVGGHRYICDTRPCAHRFADFGSMPTVQPAASCGLHSRLIARYSCR
jgi:hypothetical protein